MESYVRETSTKNSEGVEDQSKAYLVKILAKLHHLLAHPLHLVVIDLVGRDCRIGVHLCEGQDLDVVQADASSMPERLELPDVHKAWLVWPQRRIDSGNPRRAAVRKADLRGGLA
eukprot:scaffold207_cov267-Pinguiococcus_pyrenoidosus.AAC.16